MRRPVALLTLTALVVSAVAGTAAADTGADTSPWTSRQVLNVAHAGGDLEAPHSTLFAMKTAVTAGTDVLEMDLRLSADGVLMVQHDDTVNRTTEATGPVSALTAAQLQSLDNAYWFVPDCWSCHDRPAEAYRYRGIRTGERPAPAGFTADDFRIPTLADVVTAFPDRILDVEIKDGPTGMAAAEALAQFITSHGPSSRYLVASFDDAIIEHFRSLAPDVATSPGLGATTQWFLAGGSLAGFDVLQVPPVFSGIEVVTQDFVDRAHADGLAVWVWFNGNDDDSAPEWQRLIDLGVDALLTGKPAAAQVVIDANHAGFTAAPSVGALTAVHRRTATIGFSCPVLHVATCQSQMVAVAQRRNGDWTIIGEADAVASRGTTTAVPMRLTAEGRGLVRAGPLQVLIGLPPRNGDTAAAILTTRFVRR